MSSPPNPVAPPPPPNRREQSLSLALPITTHYKINNRTLILFLESYKRGFNAIAYQYGKQFVETALFELPKHGYFKSSRHQKEREKSSVEAWQVTKILETMLGDESSTARDTEEYKSAADENLVQSVTRIDLNTNERKKEQNEIRLMRNIIAKIYDSSLKSISECIGANTLSLIIDNDTEGDKNNAKDKETLWSEWIEILNENAATRLCTSLSLGSKDIAEKGGSRMKSDKRENDEPLSKPLYPFVQTTNMFPLLDSTLPQLKNDTKNESDVESSISVLPPKKNKSTAIQISSLTQCYFEDYQHLLRVGKVTIHHLKTYQGKNSPNGINGCTVIAPLIGIYHFMDDSSNPIKRSQESSQRKSDFDAVSPHLYIQNQTLSDEIVEEIIDVQAPVILPYVRGKLGLTKDALIIPSDVHDYLLEESLLNQNQFVGVCGGNILDKEHLEQLMKILSSDSEEEENVNSGENRDASEKPEAKPLTNLASDGDPSDDSIQSKSQSEKARKINGKMAATMFYHEHVICILRHQNIEDGYFFEIIDSFPNRKTIEYSSNSENKKKEPLSEESNSIQLINYQKENSQHEADARMAQMIMIQQQREKVEQMRNMSLIEGITMVDRMDENVAVALAAAVSAEEAERAAAASSDTEDWEALYGKEAHELESEKLTFSEGKHNTETPVQLNAVRITCKDLESLEATLLWYSCSRFSEENIEYIDEYEWDDRNIEFDPRVFQAFIWTESG